MFGRQNSSGCNVTVTAETYSGSRALCGEAETSKTSKC